MVTFKQRVAGLNEYKAAILNAKTIENNLIKLAKDNFAKAKKNAQERYMRELKK